MSEKPQKQPKTRPSVTVCVQCNGHGRDGVRICGDCNGMIMGKRVEHQWLYFGRPLNRYHIQLRHARQSLFRVEMGIGIGLMLICLSFILWQFFQAGEIAEINNIEHWQENSYGIQTAWWFFCLFLTFLLYRDWKEHPKKDSIPALRFSEEKVSPIFSMNGTLPSWQDIRKLPSKNRVNISQHYSDDSIDIIEQAYHLADQSDAEFLMPLHVFYALLSSDQIVTIFVRLGISMQTLQQGLARFIQRKETTREPEFSLDFVNILFTAYEEARRAGQEAVHITELFIACIQESTHIQELFYRLGVDKNRLDHVIGWIRINEDMRRQYRVFQKAASQRNKYGLDKAMTAVATPMLNAFSKDLTMAAIAGNLTPCVAQDKKMHEIFRIIDAGRQSVILVGDHGVGRRTLIEGVVERMIEERVPDRMKDKRLVQLSISALLAGTTVSGAQERLIQMINELARARNIILFIENIHDLIGSSEGSGESTGLDVSETLAEFMASGHVLVLATTTIQAYNQQIAHSQLSSVMAKVDVEEMNEGQTIQVLESKIGMIEYKQNVFFTYDAIEAGAKLAKKYLHEQRLPESAVELVTEAAAYTRQEKGINQLVTREDVAMIINQKTGVPVQSLTEDETSKLLRLEDEMHQRVIGQSEAVKTVSSALRRARANVRSSKRPIANFLFLGSTGVGKTELAKTIAEVYFGGQKSMVRVDMSEYQDPSSLYRLIGQPGKAGTGTLTEAVRHQPFSLVLLDEMEKADPKVLDIFLQVFDDGRLTDSVGQVVDFTNTIMIATSNAGTQFVQTCMQKGMTHEQIREQLMRTELKKYFRPEFINRFDAVIVFTPLKRDEIKQIARLMLGRIAKDLDERGVTFDIREGGLEALAQVGYDPEFGARPMRRAIQNHVEDPLADMLLRNQLQRGDTLVYDGQFRIERR